MQKMTMTAAIRQYFGPRKPDQTASEWMAELKALTQDDRDDLKVMFKTVGIEIIER